MDESSGWRMTQLLAGGYGNHFDKVHTSWASELVNFTSVTQRPASYETKQAIHCISLSDLWGSTHKLISFRWKLLAIHISHSHDP